MSFLASPKAYAKIALEQMEAQGLYAQGKKWDDIKSKTLEETKNAKSYKETSPYLEKALTVAGRKHSFLETSEDNSQEDNAQYPKVKLNDNKVLVVKLPEFTGNEKEATHYANIINQSLQKENYKGVILDLRNNTGGDMGPMFGGISSLLKNGTLVTYIDKDNDKTEVTLKGSETTYGGTPVKLKNTKKVKSVPIAVLINDQTASSGEITALSLKGKSDVKYFGDNSASYTSANTSIKLYDDTMMNLTTQKLKDNAGKIYENNPIVPDVKTKHPEQDAIEWLQQTMK